MKETRALQMLATELDGLIDVSKAVTHEDNEACIKTATSDVGSSRTKHIDMKFHCCRDMTKAGHAQTVHVPTQLQLADSLTKDLGRETRNKHIWAWGLRDSSGSHWAQ